MAHHGAVGCTLQIFVRILLNRSDLLVAAGSWEVLLLLQSLDIRSLRLKNGVLPRKVELLGFRLREVVRARAGIARPGEHIFSFVDRLPQLPLILTGVPVS